MPDHQTPDLAEVRSLSESCPGAITIPYPTAGSNRCEVLIDTSVGPVTVATVHAITPEDAEALAAALLLSADVARRGGPTSCPAEVYAQLPVEVLPC